MLVGATALFVKVFVMLEKNTIVLRPILWKEIRQCWKSWYLCATDLLKLHNKKTWEKKEVSKFASLKTTSDYANFLDTQDPAWLKSIEVKRGKNAATRMHPKMFIDFACRLSVEFKDRVYTIALDKLIEERTLNSEEFKKMQNAVKQYIWHWYGEEATMVNKIVTWSIARKQRKRMDEKTHRRMQEIQNLNTTLISMWIPSEKRKKILENHNKTLL